MDLRISLLNFNFVMIYISYKILIMITNYINYFKNNIFKCFPEKH